jgi:hypothetical protein
MHTYQSGSIYTHVNKQQIMGTEYKFTRRQSEIIFIICN